MNGEAVRSSSPAIKPPLRSPPRSPLKSNYYTIGAQRVCRLRRLLHLKFWQRRRAGGDPEEAVWERGTTRGLKGGEVLLSC